ncbi:MAG: hypothetical protein ACOYOT_07165 [Bacteroidales bacterium]
MKKIYDYLIFDNRKPDNLFDEPHLRQPYYADIVKRWSNGALLTVGEQSIVSNILIYTPDFVLENNKIPEFIALLRLALNSKYFEDQKSPEKGLVIYTLAYLLFKTGNAVEAISLLSNLKPLLKKYNCSEDRIFDNIEITEQIIHIVTSDTNQFTSQRARIAKAYFEIISRIMDLNELLWLEPAFTIDQIPVPDTSIFKMLCYNLRIKALDLFNENSHQEALKYYQILRLAKYELPGTFIHFVRVKLSLGDIAQSQFYTAMAWRQREKASYYVQGRILFMIILLNVIQSKPFEIWIACLKNVVSESDMYMFWEMDKILNQYTKEMSSDDSKLLNGILKLISLNIESEELDSLAIWQNAVPLSIELWPEYQIVQ